MVQYHRRRIELGECPPDPQKILRDESIRALVLDPVARDEKPPAIDDEHIHLADLAHRGRDIVDRRRIAAVEVVELGESRCVAKLLKPVPEEGGSVLEVGVEAGEPFRRLLRANLQREGGLARLRVARDKRKTSASAEAQYRLRERRTLLREIRRAHDLRRRGGWRLLHGRREHLQGRAVGAYRRRL